MYSNKNNTRDVHSPRQSRHKTAPHRIKRDDGSEIEYYIPTKKRKSRIVGSASLSNQAAALGQNSYIRLAAIIIIVAFLLFVITYCTHPNTEQTDSPTVQSQFNALFETVSTQLPAEDITPNREALVSLVGEEATDAIISTAASDLDALWVASHPEKLAFDGSSVQVKLLKLLANDPQAAGFVHDSATIYPMEEESNDVSIGTSASSPSPDVPETNIPYLYQWDRRWGNTVYCSTTFGLTGCGPTSLAMIYQGLCGKDDLTPYDFGLIAQKEGYMTEFDGTLHGFFKQAASEFGLTCTKKDATASNIVSELSAGHPIIINFAPGYFTEGGHFAVLAGLDDNGKVILNDPFSVVRSSQTWDASFLASEARLIYVYSK